MTNDRLSQFEREIRAKSEARDAELSEYRAKLAEVVGKQAELGDRLTELAALVNTLRNIQPPSLVALWGPTVTTATAVALLGNFILTTTVEPIARKAQEARQDARELSARYGELSRKQATDEEKLRWHDEWIGSVQQAVTRIDQALTATKVKEAERQ